MSKRGSRNYKWFIEPLDSNTNAAIAGVVKEQDAIEIDEDTQAYRVSRKKLAKFRNSKRQCGFRFNVLVQEGNGAIRPATFFPFVSRRSATFSRQTKASKPNRGLSKRA